ncbi:hypothetical protein STXM2123_210 [Streptomyces sp. F-3]|nr:hypothetical protein STXM2123_210 [Streptomyces sp. F-3]
MPREVLDWAGVLLGMVPSLSESADERRTGCFAGRQGDVRQ